MIIIRAADPYSLAVAYEGFLFVEQHPQAALLKGEGIFEVIMIAKDGKANGVEMRDEAPHRLHGGFKGFEDLIVIIPGQHDGIVRDALYLLLDRIH